MIQNNLLEQLYQSQNLNLRERQMQKPLIENEMYSATEQGEIVSYYKNKRTVLKGFFNKKTGYRKVQIMIDGKMKDYLVHVLVAEAFAGRLLKTNQCTHHQDHNSSNNKPSNLCIMTIEQHLKLHADEKKGISLTQQHKRKISESNKGRVISQQVRKKISQTEKGKIVSEETKQKMRHSHSKRKYSHSQTPQSIAKMLQTRKKNKQKGIIQ